MATYSPHVRSEPQQDQPSARADLEHPLRRQRRHPGHGLLDLLAHLVGGDREARVAAVPAHEVELGVGGDPLVAVGFLVQVAPLLDVLAGQLTGAAVAFPRHDVRDQARVAALMRVRDDDGIADLRVAGDRSLDLGRLHAEATELDLVVQPSEELQILGAIPAHPVARPVQPRARLEGMGHELLGSELRPPHIAACEGHTAEAQLPGSADRHGLEVAVEHVRLHVRERPPDRRGAVRPQTHVARRRDDGVLRRPVVVDEAEGERPGRSATEPVAAGEQDPQGELLRPVLLERGLGERRRQERERDPLTREPLHEARRARAGRLVHQVHAGTCGQSGPDLPYRRVEPWRRQLRRPVGGGHPILADVPVDQVGQTEVRDPDALRPAGRAGGIDDVCQVLGRRTHAGGLVREGCERGRGAVEVDDLRVDPLQGRGQRRLGDDDRRTGVAQHEREPSPRGGGIEREVRRARLQHAEHGRDHPRRALEQHAHQRSAPRAPPAQELRDPVRTALELPVGEHPAAAGQRKRARLLCCPARHLRRHVQAIELATHACAARDRLTPLLVVEQRLAPDRARWVAGDRGCQRLEVARDGRGRLRVEEVRRVFQPAAQAIGRLPEVEAQVEERGRPADVEAGVRVWLRRRARLVRGEELECDLEERVAAEVPLWLQLLHKRLEWHVLMGVGAERGVPHATQQLEEVRIALEVDPHDERVDEEPDQGLQLAPAAVGRGTADDDLALARVARQQDRIDRQQGHERRGPCGAADLHEAPGDVGREGDPDRRAVEALGGRPRAVGWELERSEARELAAPVLELGLEPPSAQPVALPGGEVAVLNRELREAGRPAQREVPVQGPQLADEHLHRPAVRDDMVHRHEQDVVRQVQPDEHRANERPGAKVERAKGLPRRQPEGLGLALGSRHFPQVHHRQGERGSRRDHLDGMPVLDRERRAQRLVALDDGVHRALERWEVEHEAQPDVVVDVVEGVSRGELVEEPEALLREGERWRLRRVSTRDARSLGRGGPAQPPLEQRPLGVGEAVGRGGVARRAHARSLNSSSASASDRSSSSPMRSSSTARAIARTVPSSNSVRSGRSIW